MTIELLSGYLDGELGTKQKEEVESHLAECTSCRKELEELRQLDEHIRTMEIEEPTREFVFGLTRDVIQKVRKKRRFSFLLLTPMLVPVAVAALVIVVLVNINQPGRFISLDDRIIYAEVETKKDWDLQVPELSVARGTREEVPKEALKEKRITLAEKKALVEPPPSAPSVAKAKAAEKTEEIGEAEGVLASTDERDDETISQEIFIEELAIPQDVVVRAIVDSNGRIVRVATGNSIVPEKDTMLENRLQGQQLRPPIIGGRRTQLYVDFTQKKEKKD